MFWRPMGALAAAVGMAAATMGLMTTAVASASPRARSHQQPVVRPRFRYVGAADWIWTGARYALAGAGAPLPGPVPYTPAMLIDDQTGQRKMVGQAGCYPLEPSALEPPDLPWVPFNCAPLGQPPAPELYSPATGQWLAVSPGSGITNPCGAAFCEVSYFLRAAGRFWLEYQQDTCDSGGEHCSSSNVFQNIQTGELRQDPSGGSTGVDLNAPDLTLTVCRPLSVPTADQPYSPPGPGSLIYYGSFALSIGTYNNADTARRWRSRWMSVPPPSANCATGRWAQSKLPSSRNHCLRAG
jgi:hypothetical protein